MLHRDRLLTFCRALPHATEDVKWGADLCFSIGGKMFAVFGLEGGATFSCKATEEAFHALTAGSDGGIIPAPYVARYFWIQVKDPKALTDARAESLIRESYELVLGGLPAKVRKGFGDAPAQTKVNTAKGRKPPKTKASARRR